MQNGETEIEGGQRETGEWIINREYGERLCVLYETTCVNDESGYKLRVSDASKHATTPLMKRHVPILSIFAK